MILAIPGGRHIDYLALVVGVVRRKFGIPGLPEESATRGASITVYYFFLNRVFNEVTLVIVGMRRQELRGLLLRRDAHLAQLHTSDCLAESCRKLDRPRRDSTSNFYALLPPDLAPLTSTRKSSDPNEIRKRLARLPRCYLICKFDTITIYEELFYRLNHAEIAVFEKRLKPFRLALKL